MTTAAKQTSTLRLTRVFKHPREKVFNAFMDPQIYRQWTAPGNFKVTDVVIDPKTGRGQRYTMLDLDDGDTYIWDVRYEEVIEPEKIVWTSIWVEGFFDTRETRVTMIFTEVNDGTQLSLTHEFFPSDQVRDSHGLGWSHGLDALAALLEKL